MRRKAGKIGRNSKVTHEKISISNDPSGQELDAKRREREMQDTLSVTTLQTSVSQRNTENRLPQRQWEVRGQRGNWWWEGSTGEGMSAGALYA